MRKLLLASAAMLGGVAGGQAFAQSTAPLPPTWTEAPQPTAQSGVASGNSNLTAQGFYTKGPLPIPTPGSVVVRFNGRVVFYGVGVNQTGNTAPAPAGSVGSYKNQAVGTLGYFRFYTGLDGMTVGGLRYGAAAEIRQNNRSSAPSATSGGASAATFGGTLYVRRAFVYVGGEWGAFHFGQDDGPTGLLDAGVTTFQTYNDGGWNDDLNDIATAMTPTFPFPSGIGNEYATSKFVYMSPQIAGFDFMGSYEPTDNPLADCCAQSGTNAPAVSSGIATATPGGFLLSSVPNTDLTDQARRRNTVEVGARYQGAFGPAGIYAFASYIGSGTVQNNGGPQNYNGLNDFFGGIAVNFGGFRVGGAYFGGRSNDQLALQPVGGVSEHAWLAGVQYTLGAMTVGASYFDDISTGAVATTATRVVLLPGQRNQGGINVGGTYVIAPGLLAWLSASYGQVHQGGFNWVSGTPGPDNNSGIFRAVAIGGMVRW